MAAILELSGLRREWQASADAALERAAQLADAHNEEHFAKPDAGVYRNCGAAIAMNIRALKGSRV